MRRGAVALLVLALLGGGGAIAYAAFTTTTSNPGNAFSAAATFGGMRVQTGTYNGNGMNNRPIAVAFQPDVVIVKGNTNQNGVLRSSTMTGDATKPLAGATGLTANLIKTLTATGFTVGTDARVNGAGPRYDWIAFKTYSNQMTAATYAGTGLSQSVNTGFSPDYVITMRAGASAPIQRSRSMGASYRFDGNAAAAAGVNSLDANGFTVGTSNEANANGSTYHYLAWNAVHGLMNEGSYSGDGVDNRSITGATFQPEYAMVRSSANGNNCDRQVHRPATLTAGSSLYFANVANLADAIQNLEADGFQVGTNCRVNTNGGTYYWAAFRTGN
jgi:hypothetical protein